MKICVLDGKRTKNAIESRFGSLCERCVDLLVRAAAGGNVDIWSLENTGSSVPDAEPQTDVHVHNAVKQAIQIAEDVLDGTSAVALPELNAEAHLWAAAAYLENGMRAEAVAETVRAFRKATDELERIGSVNFLLRADLLKCASAEALHLALAGSAKPS
ncbi:MAG: hypothetical protein WCS09_20700 [Pseudomonadota bacterium]